MSWRAVPAVRPLLDLALAAALATAGFPPAARAQTSTVDLNLSGSGARATGMGGAFIGVADDATAAMWNPAGLTQLERPEASLVTKVVVERIEPEGFERLLEPAETQSGHVVLDFASAVYPIRAGDRKVVLALSYQHLLDVYESSAFFFEEGARSLEQRGGVDAIAPGMAFRLLGPLAFGGSLNFWSGDLRIVERQINPGPTPPQDRTLQGLIDTDFSGFNLTAGMLADLESVWPALPVRVGAVFRQPFALAFDSAFRLTSGGVTTLESRGSGEIHMPLMVGAGGSVRWRQHWTLAADVERRHFPDTDYSLAATDSLPPGSRGPGLDLTEVRLGAEYTLVGERFVFPLRAGLRVIPASALDGAPRSSDSPINESTTWVWAGGAGCATSRFSVDGAVELRLFEREQAGAEERHEQLSVAFSAIVYF